MPSISSMGPVKTMSRLVPGRARSQRRTWVGNERAHIEVRGVHHSKTEDYARHLEEELTGLDGVHWAEVNAVVGRVVVAFDGDEVGLDDLIEVIEGVEEAHEMHLEAFPEERPEHPGDVEPLHRQMFSLGADVVGLGLSAVGGTVRRRPLPAEVASVLSLVDSTPRLRALLEQRVGEASADLLLASANALGQGLAQGPLGLLVDAAHRLALIGDISARREVWAAREPELHGGRSRTGTLPVEHEPRPVPLPSGPVERYADQAALASIAAALTTFGITRDQSKVVTALVCGTPKGARLTREVFTSTLGRALWRRGIVPLDASALRRLDRVDTVVVDGGVLLTGKHVLGSLEATPDAVESESELRMKAADLLDPDEPGVVRRRRGWTIGPLTKVAAGALGARAASRRVRRPGGVVLGLLHGRRLVAVLCAEPELDGLGLALAASASAAGRLLVAGERSGLMERIGAEDALPAGTHLAGAIRGEQAAGHTVALVAHEGDAALRAADCAIGLLREAHDPPWGADLLCGPGLGHACRILDSASAARAVSQRAALVALYGSVAAALLALAGPRRGATARALIGINGAAAAGMALGAASATSLDRRPDPLPVGATAWHAMAPAAALRRLGASEQGLTEEEAGRRHAAVRREEEPEEVGIGQAAAEELRNPLTPALATGAGMSAASGAVTDAILVGSVMGVNALLGGAQRVGASRALRRLQDASAVRTRVIRDGSALGVAADSLVLGDVVELQAGDTVPADCRILDAAALEVDESSLTGESQLVRKDPQPTAAGTIGDRTSMLYEGTVVAAGRARAVVVAAGAETEAARAAYEGGAQKSPRGGVHARLHRLTRAAVPASLGAGVAMAAVDMFRGRELRDTLGTGVSLAVAAVPEGLPLVATVAQLAAARRLSARQALVRNPTTVETLGRVDVLCFDKTGTLTEGHVRVGLVTDGKEEEPVDGLGARGRKVLVTALRASPAAAAGQRMAHPTDTAVVLAARRAGLDVEGWTLVDEVPFEPARGYHAALGGTPDRQLLSVKGAPEIVLPLCTTWQHDGQVTRLDKAARSLLAAKVDGLARRGYRVLAVAERAASKADLDEQRVARLSFLGLLALADPVRREAKEAVAGLRRAGIEIVMVTGDHPTTAEAIAAELDILNGREVMTGTELDRLGDETLGARLSDVSVFARVTPAHKVRIVTALRKAGRTVAMTGDGANDAAAIRLADVGVAMGERATDAARQAADLVVTDDRIETIIDAIVEGRSMWISVRDAVSVLVGGNLGEIAFSLGTGVVSRRGSALNARQLLLVNLLTDLLPSLALSVRAPEHHDPEALLVEGPDRSLGGALTRDVAVRAVSTGAAAGGAWALARGTGTRAHASTVGLVALVGTQLGQTALAGWRNPLVLAGSAASAGVLAAAVQTPGVSHFFGCRPLGPVGWATALSASAAGTGAAAALSRLLPDLDVSSPTPTAHEPTGNNDEPGAPPAGHTRPKERRRGEELV